MRAMNTRYSIITCFIAAFMVVTGWSTAAAEENETHFVAELIWGTNSEKPADKDFKPISPDLKKRLRRVFKWQNYFEIKRKDFTASPDKPSRVEMSRECRLDVASVGANEYEIQLYGKGVLVVTKRQRIQPGEIVVLAGDDKEDDAWFVVLSLAKTPPAQR